MAPADPQDTAPDLEGTSTAANLPAAAPAAEPAEDRGEPYYYVADEPLILAGDGGFARAHAAGDHVPPDHVHRYGWRPKVHDPRDGAPAPAAGPPSQQGGDPDRDALITTNGDGGRPAGEPQDGDPA